MQFHLGASLGARSPVVLEISDARLLPRRADAVVEVERFPDALFDGEAARAQVFEFANVGRTRFVVAHQRPDFSIFSDWIQSMPVPMGADRNLCRLVPK